MKHIKILGLVVVAGAALMAFAGTASATVVTSNGSAFTGTISGSNENGHVSLHGSNGVTIECGLSLEGTVEKHGAAVTAEGPYTQVGFPSCTGGHVVHTISIGRVVAHATGSGNGKITSVGTKVEVTVKSIFGTITCVYDTGTGTEIGTFTGSTTTKGKATIDFAGTVPRTGGSALCGSTGVITGFGIVNSPTNLNLD